MPFKFFHPRYWATWLGVAFLHLVILLPWKWQMTLGEWIGKLLYRVLPARRKISCINLQIAFPDLSVSEQEKLNRKHFISLGQGLIEAALGWWGSEKQIQKLTHIEGTEYLEKAKGDQRVLLLGSHFASLEVGGRIIANHMPLHAVYRPHQNALIEYLVAKQRTINCGKAIPKTNIRELIKSIKGGFPSWYATDQNYRGKGSILVPFFGIEAPTNPGTTRLAKMTKAIIIPCICVRLLDNKEPRKGYLLRFYPPVEDFPSNDVLADTTRLNQIIEAQIKDFPAQYLWTHKRYKHYKDQNKDFYADYLASHEASCQ
ncbi:MAG TPA: lipid A biosynthesis lauroyl acyltransferase [Leucothrix sp.]|nr:lipid A biosynthesis lauroyl acyltransferase [Leucothrix sp.]